MATTEFIAAIELSSSKISGIAGKKNSDGSIQVLAYAREDASSFIHKGVIYNIDKTAQALTSIINKLESQLNNSIAKVYVGIGGQSLRTVKNAVSRVLEEEGIISQELVDAISDENLEVPLMDMSVLDVAPQEYKIDNNLQADPVGVAGKRITGNFLNIVARASLKKNLEHSFEQAKVEIADLLIAPIALANAVLTESEMRSGCALVDFGADTTTVSVYKNNKAIYKVSDDLFYVIDLEKTEFIKKDNKIIPVNPLLKMVCYYGIDDKKIIVYEKDCAYLYDVINNKRIFSMILYGNPGIGKTSIACAIAGSINEKYRVLNATVNNKKDIEVVIEEAKMYDGIVLIMDEIHRLNKDKQDILLPHLESGLITLIGLTTSNPYHKINPAIRSRCQIFELKPLTLDEVIEGLNRAIKCEDLKGIKIKKDVIEYIAKLSSGDLRSAYNLLEICYYSTSDKNITMDVVTKINNKPALFADKDETGHYDLLSAFQKSIRGSDVNAALHYLARLLVIEDLDSIYRRMTVIAYEDIGLANPSMGPKVDACINACERVGMPEAMIPLSVTITEMALSPKSNSAYSALHDAIKDIESGNNYPIPETIRIDSTIYKYPHDYKGSFVVQQYMPDNLINKIYYKPKLTSKYEQNLALIDQRIKKIKEQSK